MLIRDKDGRGRSTRLLDSIADVLEDGEAQVSLAGFLGVGSADNLGA